MPYQSSTQFIDVGLESNCLTIAFNRPGALNALRPEVLSEAAQLIEKTKSDENVMVVVLARSWRSILGRRRPEGSTRYST